MQESEFRSQEMQIEELIARAFASGFELLNY
jgi:hypothetical protein